MTQVTLYGADWCPDCVRAKSFLKENSIEFTFVDVDLDQAATKRVEEINGGKRIIPTIYIDDVVLSNPDNAELSSHLGINPNGPRVILYGADWCPDCKKSKSFLTDNGVNYQYVNIDDAAWSIPIIEKINNGKRRIPTIMIGSETVLSVPENDELAAALAIEQTADDHVYDAIIIGGGAAGLTTAIYAQRDRFNTLILERKTIGGNAFLTEKIENYPGFETISGPDLMGRMEAQAITYGAKIKTGESVSSISRGDDQLYNVTTGTQTYRTKAVVLASGSTYRKLNIPLEDELIGSGVHYCATCDGPFYRDRDVIVIGGGNSALEEGIFLAQFAKSVKIVQREKAFTASPEYVEKLPDIANVSTFLNQSSIGFEANEDGSFKGLRVKDNDSGNEQLLEADGAFVFIGLVPNTKDFKEVVELDERGFIKTTGLAATSQAGIFAAGDVRAGAIAQVAAATGEGVLASYGLRDYLRSQE